MCDGLCTPELFCISFLIGVFKERLLPEREFDPSNSEVLLPKSKYVAVISSYLFSFKDVSISAREYPICCIVSVTNKVIIAVSLIK